MIMLRPDPLNTYPNADPEYILECLGYIPSFILTALEEPKSTFSQDIMEVYGFGGAPMTGGEIQQDGVYTYPKDPDLYPLAILETERGDVICYRYGITAIIEKGESYDSATVYRMD